jgi:hypothetical protein
LATQMALFGQCPNSNEEKGLQGTKCASLNYQGWRRGFGSLAATDLFDDELRKLGNAYASTIGRIEVKRCYFIKVQP